jgi:hypothetical protein
MQRWISISVGAGAVALAIGITAKSVRAPSGAGAEAARRSGDSGAFEDGPTRAQPHLTAPPLGRLDNLLDPPGEALPADSGTVALAEGMPVPPLPASAPRRVRFGVVLVSYAGAQPEASGGRPATRSHADAKVLAEKLAAGAAQDFHSAVQQGDPGSSDDVGTVKLGILEPAAEFVLFSLPIDGIGGPVDTPRGYWVVKRLE